MAEQPRVEVDRPDADDAARAVTCADRTSADGAAVDRPADRAFTAAHMACRFGDGEDAAGLAGQQVELVDVRLDGHAPNSRADARFPRKAGAACGPLRTL